MNLKILLDLAVADGRIDGDERRAWLGDLSDDVVGLVLGDVDRQCARLSRDVAVVVDELPAWSDAIDHLEELGLVDRAVHHLPTPAEFAERRDQGAGLTRPELATVLASSKRWLTSCGLTSGLASSPGLDDALDRYFPAAVLEVFGDLVDRHRLRDELVATTVANAVVDQFGPVHVHALHAETGHDAHRVVAALWAARGVVDADRWWALARSATWLAPTRVEGLLAPIDDVVTWLARQYLDDPLLDDVAALVARDHPVWQELRDQLPHLGSPRQRQQASATVRQLSDDLVDDQLAGVVAHAHVARMTADLGALQREVDGDLGALARAMLLVDERFQLEELAHAVTGLPATDAWTTRARSGLLADVGRLRLDAVRRAAADVDDPVAAVDGRFPVDHPRIRGAAHVVREALSDPSHASLGVAVRSLHDLLRPI